MPSLLGRHPPVQTDIHATSQDHYVSQEEDNTLNSGDNPISQRRGLVTEIARVAGVSKSTVSRALSGSPQVSAATIQRIRKLADQLSSTSATTITEDAQTRTVAVIAPTDAVRLQRLAHPFYVELTAAIGSQLTTHGYGMMISALPLWSDRAIEEFRKKGNIKGYIVIGHTQDSERINAIREQFNPLVAWGAQIPGQKYCSVGSENIQSSYTAVRHLLRLGRKQILFIGSRQYLETSLRYDGYTKALAEAGLEPDEELILDVPPFDPTRFSSEITRRIESGLKFDGIFTTSDLLAMCCITACEKHGLSVPRDISVIGFDDIRLAAFFNPPLTTIRQNTNIGASLLVEKLLRMMAGETVESETLAAELVIRDSC